MFLKRSNMPELMDDFSIQDERIDQALNELKNTNRYLGGVATTKCGIKILLREKLKNKLQNDIENISILDVGAGASDNLLKLTNDSLPLNITSIDLNKRACRYLNKNSDIIVICADALKLPINEKKFEIVHSALFLHHFKEEEIKIMLEEFLSISKFGIIINDLRRSVLALAGIKIISFIFSKSEFYKNDGPLSVKRGFVKKDWLKILNSLGIKNYIIKRTWAFRWLIVIYNEQ